MKVLIIGSKSMLGQELMDEFQSAGYEILGWDKEDIDITKRDKVIKNISELKPEIIVNAAAYNAVDKIEEGEKELAEAVNGYAVGNLSEAAQMVGAILVHYSTDYVFEGKEIDGYKEDDEPKPQSVYARSKWIGEQLLINPKSEILISKQVSNSKQNPKSKIQNLKYYLIRTSRLFGKPAISEGAKKSFVDVMLKLAEEKDSLELVDEEMSSPTYVCDLARRTREIIEWQKPFGIYHATNAGGCTWYGWAKKIFEISGKSVKLVPVGADKFPRPAKRPKYSVLLNTKLPPMRSWESALEEYIRMINKNN
jgi:dTDP-4-dehydrorhamnose reductase